MDETDIDSGHLPMRNPHHHSHRYFCKVELPNVIDTKTATRGRWVAVLIW
jgi:hypothetical protein